MNKRKLSPRDIAVCRKYGFDGKKAFIDRICNKEVDGKPDNGGNCASSFSIARPRWLMASFSSGVSWA